MMLLNLKTMASEIQSRNGRSGFAKTVVSLVCLGAVLACGLPVLAADSHSYTYGSAHHSPQPGFRKLITPTTRTGSYGKNGLPCSTPRSAGSVASRTRSGQQRELDRMMREDMSLSGKARRDRSASTSASTYKPLSTQISGQGSGINFTSRSNQSVRKR